MASEPSIRPKRSHLNTEVPAPALKWAGTEYEKALRSAGYIRVAGVDEVGRGPLAGPVVACALMLPADAELPGVTDSKQLSDAARRSVLPRILESAVAFGVGVVDSDEIDRINILQATFAAMRKALEHIECDALIVDGRLSIPGVDSFQMPRAGADAQSLTVAAASIVAKVTRDDFMSGLDQTYPGYGFGAHKGYATRAHFDALDRLGPCAVHRQSFLGRWRLRKSQAELEC